MTARRVLILSLSAALVLGTAACSNVKKQLGVGRNSPDEFTVVKRAPLTLPPDYGLIPPETASAPPAARATDRARSIVLGAGAGAAEKGDADAAFLRQLGTDGAQTDIRSVIDRDNGYIALKNETLTKKLAFWKDDDPLASAAAPDADTRVPSSVVDPAAEAARLKKNREDGKPLNAGQVPTIEKKPSTIDRIF